MFLDKADIEVRAGNGGDGALSFRHEKYREKGGPDGGNGGRGGDVIFLASHNQNTLSKYRTNRLVVADSGRAGGGNRKAGRGGDDVTIAVPVGTQIMEDDKVLADLNGDGQAVIIAHGGRGGFGNAHFVGSVRQAPRLAERGEAGERRKLTLELKLVADVGLVGLPNAGKSTLLSVISNAKPEIADYPFTTLVPNLGVVDFEEDTFLVADIPGLIEGASLGKGLGDDFLRHIERTAVILHLISVSSDDVAADYRTIIRELKSYKIDLSDRPQLVVLTKIETISDTELAAKTKKLKTAIGRGAQVFAISAVAHRGLDELLRAAAKLVVTARVERARVEAEAPKAIIDQASFPNLWQLDQEEGGNWRVSGGAIEGHGRRTDWANPDAVERIRDILRKTGIAKELLKRGAVPGDIIKIGPNELEWL